ncbi:hypothetical protein L6164_030891 [Bauhinia variegata]|uniref:Uncharacterized protein n=1 Tax=Bauhinia variegata TaxID=167791 RepID=A0ACB9LE73_BAUVA|nr:hypothetical protein L6164_030891 [Bauhinia variegata]
MKSPEKVIIIISCVSSGSRTENPHSETDRRKDMEWLCGDGSLMEEQAKEELEMIEAQYPNHFQSLKLELKSFIFLLQTQKQETQLIPENNCSTSPSSMVDTQESTSLEQAQQRRKSNCSFEAALKDRVVMEGKIDEDSQLASPKSDKVVKKYSGRMRKRKDRVDVVLEMAQGCLKKIKLLKATLLSSA